MKDFRVVRPGLYSLLLILPLLLFYGAIAHFAVDIPIADDFASTLRYILNIESARFTLSEKVRLTFGQHMEHKIVFSRLVALIQYLVLDRVDLYRLILLQNAIHLAWIPILGYLFYRLPRPVSGWLLLPPVLLLFNLNLWESSLWVSSGLQSYPAAIFTVLSLILFDRASRDTSASPLRLSFLLACGSAVLACFSFGSGFLCLLTGLLLLLLKRANRWTIGTWIVVSVLIATLYFVDYQKPRESAPMILALQHPLQIIKFLVKYCGSWSYYNVVDRPAILVNFLFCYLLGGGLMLYLAYLVYRRYWAQNPLVFTILTNLLLIAALLSVSRYAVGSYGPVISRYQLFACLLLAFSLLSAYELFPALSRRFALVCSLALLHYAVIYYRYLPSAQQWKETATANILQWEQYGRSRFTADNQFNQFAAEVLLSCEQQAIYQVQSDTTPDRRMTLGLK